MADSGELSFGVPPSLGKEPSFELAREFADVLYGAGFTSVMPYKTYDALQTDLLSGKLDAAWGPPVICARCELKGGRVVHRAIRRGATTYRSALINRRQDRWDLNVVKTGGFRPRVVWVDEWSTGGYLLARAFLRKEGIENSHLLNERFLGSYTACFDSLNEYDGDLTASFLGSAGTLESLWGQRTERLHILALSAESPNDGIVLSPKLSERRTSVIATNLARLMVNPHSHQILCRAFTVDGFDVPPPNTYAPLVGLISSPVSPDEVDTVDR